MADSGRSSRKAVATYDVAINRWQEMIRNPGTPRPESKQAIDIGRSPGLQVLIARPTFPAIPASGMRGHDSLFTVAGAALVLATG